MQKNVNGALNVKQISRKIFFIFIQILLLLHPAYVFAQDVIIVNTDIDYSENKLTLDADDSGGDITLQFGATLNKYLKWDSVNSYFSFNDDVNLEGNEIKNFRIDNLSSAPPCNSSSRGRMYHNTSNTNSYICNGTGWIQIDSEIRYLATVQARRTTNFTLTTLNNWYNIDLPLTDMESDNSVLEHNSTYPERIDIKEDGIYMISYHISANHTSQRLQMESRVVSSSPGGLSVLTGSTLVNRDYQNEYVPSSTSFITKLPKGSYIVLQARRTNATSTAVVINETMLNIVKLDGIKGEKGEQGLPGSVGAGTNYENFIIDLDDTGGDRTIQFGNTIVSLFGWDDSEGMLSTFNSELSFLTPHSSSPPATCNSNTSGMQWMNPDNGILYICDTSNGRNKWLSVNEMVIFGDESGSCPAGADPNSNASCNVDWGNGLGPDGATQLGFYLPYNITITGYGFSEDNDACTSGSFDLEVWGTGSNVDDNNYTFQENIATGLTGQAHNSNSLNINLHGQQYILWGIDNNCGQAIDDWNLVIYYRWYGG
jgi:hypothetical protein